MAHEWANALGLTMTTMGRAASSVESRPILNKEAVDHAAVNFFIMLLYDPSTWIYTYGSSGLRVELPPWIYDLHFLFLISAVTLQLL